MGDYMANLIKSIIGEALAGEGNEIAHIDLVIGSKGSSVETAFMNSLAMPREGHTAVWTGTEMIIWGGNDCSTHSYTTTGGRYTP